MQNRYWIPIHQSSYQEPAAPFEATIEGDGIRGLKLRCTDTAEMIALPWWTEHSKAIYAMRKETIERVFADAKEKHAMRYTHHKGLAAVMRWVTTFAEGFIW